MKMFNLTSNRDLSSEGLDPRLTPELTQRCTELVGDLHQAGFDVCLALDGRTPAQVPTWVIGDNDMLILRLERTIHALRQRLWPRSILAKTFGGRRG